MTQLTSDNPKSGEAKRSTTKTSNPAIEALRQWLDRHGHRARRVAPWPAQGR